MKQGFIVPVYRHAVTAGPLARRLAASGLPVFLVDDGNAPEEAALLAQCAAETPGVTLVRLEKNSGKGGALTAGFEAAAKLGLSHILQIDADGQHDVEQAAFFLEESAKNPDKIICGFPEFDSSAPKSRVTGRKISNFWTAVVTISTEFKDVLCGFRVYPVDRTLSVLRNPFLDRRMGADAEILVRLYWKGVFPLFYPVAIRYPPGGISNFHVVRDNIRISWMFTRLFVGMLPRLPLLVFRKIRRRKKRP